LKREFDLPLSHVALQRIWRQHGLVKKRRRKYQRKQDLAAFKATFRLFQQISADTKDLADIPHYWPQMKVRGLPAVQYTARDVRSGLQFLAFARRRSAGASALFAWRIQQHLRQCGVDLKHLTWQTDNGGEFIGQLQQGVQVAQLGPALADGGQDAQGPVRPDPAGRALAARFEGEEFHQGDGQIHHAGALITYQQGSRTK
jgi:hypothetical protein